MERNLTYFLLLITLSILASNIFGAKPRTHAYKAYKVYKAPAGRVRLAIKPLIPQKLIAVPLARQSTNWTCGVASLMSILGYYGIEYREES